jgi:small subunit ribosomal protein S2
VNLNQPNIKAFNLDHKKLNRLHPSKFKKTSPNRSFKSRVYGKTVYSESNDNSHPKRKTQTLSEQTSSLNDSTLLTQKVVFVNKTTLQETSQRNNLEPTHRKHLISNRRKKTKTNLTKQRLSEAQNQAKAQNPAPILRLQKQQTQGTTLERNKEKQAKHRMHKIKQKKKLSKTELFAFKSEHKARTLFSMIKAYIYLGHPAKKWNPKMKSFVYQKSVLALLNKKIIRMHIIDLVKSMYHAKFLSAWLTKIAMKNKKILFVGTEGPYAGLVSRAAKVCQAYYVNEKWLGGMLTNWKTIAILIEQLKDYDKLIKSWKFQRMPKQEAARILKQKNKLQKYLGGIKYMASKPDFVIVIGQVKERKVLNECKKSRIPSLSIVDTNCNPTASDLVMPSNDDSNRSLHWLFSLIVVAIKRGQLLRKGARAHLFTKLYKGALPSIAKETFEQLETQRETQREQQRETQRETQRAREQQREYQFKRQLEKQREKQQEEKLAQTPPLSLDPRSSDDSGRSSSQE